MRKIADAWLKWRFIQIIGGENYQYLWYKNRYFMLIKERAERLAFVGEKLDLSPGLKIKDTVKPEEKASYNEVFRNINRELHPNKLTHVNRRVDW